ncbi:MAG: hypothetical protein M3Z40_02840 [Bifidobacterium sp.]|nr:hypothetical protein [Bifidobacterium sp.]
MSSRNLEELTQDNMAASGDQIGTRVRAGGIPFGRILAVEIMKGRSAAPRRMALAFPLVLIIIMAVLVFGLHVWSPSSVNYWYVLLLPAMAALMSAAVASIDARQQWRTTLALPAAPILVWWAKIVYCLFLVGVATLLALGLPALMIAISGVEGPSPADFVISALMLVLACSWMIPAGLALTARFGVLIGFGLPYMADLLVSITFWGNQRLWPFLPPAAMINLPVPFMKVMPDGVPLETEDNSPIKAALSVFGGQSLTALVACLVWFLLLSVLTGIWFSRKETN